MNRDTQAKLRASPEPELARFRARIAKAPLKPGIYRWLDAEGNILYIGKAKNLRKRLKTYLVKEDSPRTQAKRVVRGPWKEALLEKIADVDWTLTANELEALMLETNLIKEHRPKFNVLMKDDKNYVYVKITTEEAYPRLEIVRRFDEPRGREAEYFGPFLSGYDLRDTLDLLHTVFAWRACKRSLDLLNRASIRASATAGATQHDNGLKECLEHQIGKCNGLCIGNVTQEEYRKRMEQVIRFFRGDRSEVMERLKVMMQEAAAAKKFENAAKLRNTLTHIQELMEQQIVSGTSGDNTDVFGVALLHDRSHVVLLKERNGKVVSELSFTLAGSAEGTSDVLSQFLPQYYSSNQDIPDTVLIRATFEGQQVLEAWLNERRKTNKRINVHVPSRGKKSKLLRMAEKNAEEKIEQQFAKWEAETVKVERALLELKNALGLSSIPKRIECYDISHLGGTETVGSMVVFLDGKPRSDHYRSFTLRTIRKGEIDDYKALREVLSRRLRHLTNTEEKWRERGVVFEKAKKKDKEFIEETLLRAEQTFGGTLDVRDVVVARRGEDVVGFGRIVTRKGAVNIIQSLWITDQFRGNKMGHAVIQKLIAKAKKGKVYVTIHPALEEYYAQAGFRYVHTAPTVIQEEMERARTKDPSFPAEGRIVMMLDLSKHTLDQSLTAIPDLLVLDGGKGQLGVGSEVLKRLNLAIPVISLAKEKEEVFSVPSPSPIPLSEEAHFLLQRARDEAHRFANRHRERRAKHALVS